MNEMQLIECPRDAMQGWPHFIATERKIEYINSLLQVGFHTIDFGSFVSAKTIPQMADTAAVVKKLNVQDSASKLLAIVANKRGAEEAVAFDEITYLGFPFSVSATFQQRNTHSSLEESLGRVEEIQTLCLNKNKKLVIYLSMGFGNPYGDEYNGETLLRWAEEMVKRGIQIISLADTIGIATPAQISFALKTLIPKHPATTFGVHLHATQFNWKEKVAAAINAGCTRIDGALKGVGGCPMAGNELVGNLTTERVIAYLEENGLPHRLNREGLKNSLRIAADIFR